MAKQQAVSIQIMIGFGVLFILLYLAGFQIGSGILGIIRKIHPIGWIIILLIVVLILGKRGK